MAEGGEPPNLWKYEKSTLISQYDDLKDFIIKCRVIMADIIFRAELWTQILKEKVVKTSTRDQIKLKGTNTEMSEALIDAVKTVGHLRGLLIALVEDNQGYLVENLGLDPDNFKDRVRVNVCPGSGGGLDSIGVGNKGASSAASSDSSDSSEESYENANLRQVSSNAQASLDTYKDIEVNVHSESAENTNNEDELRDLNRRRKDIIEAKICDNIPLKSIALPNGQFKPVDEICIFLLGKTGEGKSATGNLLLGQKKFHESNACSSPKKHVRHEETDVGSTKIRIVDTPGIKSLKDARELICAMIRKELDVLEDGIHIFLFVFSVANPRFTEMEWVTFESLEETFGKEILDHCVFLYTHADMLHGNKLSQIIEGHHNGTDNFDTKVRGIFMSIGNRVVALENAEMTEDGMGIQRQMLTDYLQRVIEQNLRDRGKAAYTKSAFLDERMRSGEDGEERMGAHVTPFIDEEASILNIEQPPSLEIPRPSTTGTPLQQRLGGPPSGLNHNTSSEITSTTSSANSQTIPTTDKIASYSFTECLTLLCKIVNFLVDSSMQSLFKIVESLVTWSLGLLREMVRWVV